MSATTETWVVGDIRYALQKLCDEGKNYELRVPNAEGGGVTAGVFHDLDKLAAAAAELSGHAPGIYVTLNPVIGPRQNKVFRHARHTAKDQEVISRRRLLIDVDPARPDKNSSSTDAEKHAALELAHQVRVDLIGRGWPEPILGDSGNGYHLIEVIDLPNDAATTALVKAVLAALDRRYSSSAVKVDTSVYNAARISKVYGTMACKGPNTPDRPHRMTRIVKAPVTLGTVTQEMLEALVAELKDKDAPPPAPAKSKPATPTGTPFDVDHYLHEHHVVVKRDEPYDGGHRWILKTCPFNPDHGKGSDTAILQLASGAVVFKCQHDGCAGTTWRDFREAVEDRPLDVDDVIDAEPAGPRTAPEDEEHHDVHVEDADWMRPEPLDTFMERDLQRGTPLIAPWLYPQDTVVIGAFRGTGKSYFGLELFIALTSGTPAFGVWPVAEPRSVALYDLENPGYLTKERIRLLRQGRPAKAEALLYSTDARGQNVELSKPDQQDRLLDVCHRQDVVVIDNISAGYHAGPENDSQTWVMLSELMLKLRRAGKTAIFMYQSGKAKDTTRGSSRLEDVVSIVLMLQSPPGWDQDQGLRVTTRFTKARGVFGPDVPRVTISLKTTSYSATWEVTRTTAATEALVETAMRELEGARLRVSASAVAERAGISKSSAATYMARVRARWAAESGQGSFDDLEQ